MKKWTQQETNMLLSYAWSDDSESVDKRLEHARYMLHNESGFDFPERSLCAVKKKFYKECKKIRKK